MFVKSLDMLFVHLAYFDYALDVSCVKLLAASMCTLSPMSTEVTLDICQESFGHYGYRPEVAITGVELRAVNSEVSNWY